MKRRASGILLIVGGVIGMLLWLPVTLLVGMLSMNPYPGAQSEVQFGLMLLPFFGGLGSVLSLIAGVLALRRRAATNKAPLILAILAALLSLPGTALLILLQWVPVYALTLLIGLAPPVYYFVDLWRHRENSQQINRN